MKRLEFLKINALATIGLGCLSLKTFQNLPDKLFLTGKRNPYLTANNLLHKTAFEAFQEMHKAAQSEHIDIKIISGFRSFNYQKSIWNRKFAYYKKQEFSEPKIIQKITTYSAIPGTSRHHWGTEIDIINANANQPESNILQAKHFHGQGYYCELDQWMQKHAHKFGFFQVYTKDNNRTGFSYEPWHYSFQPLSKPYLKDFSQIDLPQIFKKENMYGQKALTEEFLSSYFKSHVFGINSKLLP